MQQKIIHGAAMFVLGLGVLAGTIVIVLAAMFYTGVLK